MRGGLRVAVAVAVLVALLGGVHGLENVFLSTYDVRLYPWTVGVHDKISAYAEVVNSLSSDVMCVNGVYGTEVAGSFATALAPTYLPARTLTGAERYSHCWCEVNTASTALRDCAAAACGGTNATCQMAACQAEFEAVPVECRSCLSAEIGILRDSANLTAQVEICRLQAAGSSDQCYVADGHSGLLMLSRKVPSASGRFFLNTTSVAREVLYMQLSLDNKLVHVFCTQISGRRSGPGLMGTSISDATWDLATDDETEQVISYIRSFGDPDAVRVAVMGDLASNRVTSAADVSALNVNAFARWADNHYEGAFLTNARVAECLDCGSTNYAPQHLLYRSMAPINYMTARRINVVQDGALYGQAGSFVVTDPAEDGSPAGALHPALPLHLLL